MFDRNRFKNLVHYVCYRRHTNPTSLGAVKLNKILWLSDMVAYYELGEPITGSRYVKRQFGPVPHQILPVLRELENEGVLAVTDEPFHGKTKKVYSVYVGVGGQFLSEDERRIVDSMIDLVCDEHTAASVSRQSHDDVWKAAQDGEEIPYFTVFSLPGIITSEEREWARLMLEQS